MDMIFQTIMVFLAILVQWQTSMNSLKKQKRNIKVILDLVVNHTSDEHAWFQDVLKILKVVSRLLYYKEGRETPTNWRSNFGGSVWEKLPGEDAYYFHAFHKNSRI